MRLGLLDILSISLIAGFLKPWNPKTCWGNNLFFCMWVHTHKSNNKLIQWFKFVQSCSLPIRLQNSLKFLWQNIWRLYQNRQNSRKLIPAKLLAPTVSFIRRLPLWRQRLNSTIKRNRSYRQFFKLQGVKKETSVMK